MKDTILQPTVLAMGGVLKNAYAMLSGLFMSILGYFLPVKDIVHLLILFFVLDVFFGFWAAKKLRKERFSVKIIWSHTIDVSNLSKIHFVSKSQLVVGIQAAL